MMAELIREIKWRWFDWIVNRLESFCENSYFVKVSEYTLKEWKRWPIAAREIQRFMDSVKKESGDLYALAELSNAGKVRVSNCKSAYSGVTFTPLKVWSDEEKYRVVLKINLGWWQQTLARKLYGGVFPESVERDVITQHTDVARVYRWKEECDAGTVEVRVAFWKPAVDGETIDGCKVNIVRPAHRIEDYVPMSLPSAQYASVHCPMKTSERYRRY